MLARISAGTGSWKRSAAGAGITSGIDYGARFTAEVSFLSI